MIQKQQIENIVKKLKTRKSKNIIYSIVIFMFFSWFAYRFIAVYQENNFDVFNIIRNNTKNGTPVYVLQMEQQNGVLYEPLTVKNNRAYVSGARIDMFKPGQKIGNCKITSVSKNIDLDTGMHIIKTTGCENGLQYVEIKQNGFFVPVSAVHGNIVFVSDNEIAKPREIIVGGRDAQNVLITHGLEKGDIVILSDIKDGQKIKIAK